MKSIWTRHIVISLLTEIACSLNHESFVGEGNRPDNDSASLTFFSGGNFFDENFVSPLYSLPLPSKKPLLPPGRFASTTSNHHQVLNKPPTFKPTLAPVPVGRFPYPISISNNPSPPPSFAAANFPYLDTNSYPIENDPYPPPPQSPQASVSQLKVDFPHPTPMLNKPYSPPSFAPIILPYPSTNPYHNPYLPPPPPLQASVSQVKVDTRISTYTAEWGTGVNKCQSTFPNIFFNCHNGGVINVIESKNSLCWSMSSDYVQCQQNDPHSDSSVAFTCSGIRKVHLLATLNISASLVLGCKKDGNAVKYTTLSRNCVDGLGRAYVDTSLECEKGIRWMQGGTTFCASPVVCAIEQGCSELEIESVEISSKNKDIQCSHVDPTQDLQLYPFETSLISSTNLVDWRVSGQARGCLWEPSPLLLRCEGGGNLEFLESYPFCSMIPEDNMGICHSFAPFSTENEESISLLVSCAGKTEEQLVLSVEIPSEPLDVQCESEGIAIQSVMLSRGCGEYGTDGFKFINDQRFCNSPEHVFEVDDTHSYCFVGDSCELENGCYNMQLPALTADTGSNAIGRCTYTL